MSKLILNNKEFFRLSELSSYNHNYYQNRIHNYAILEKCDDDGDYFFYLIDDSKQIFIGCSQQQGIHSGAETITIDFKYFYT